VLLGVLLIFLFLPEPDPGVDAFSPAAEVGVQLSQSESLAAADGTFVFGYDLAAYRRATSDAALAFLLASSASLAASVDKEDISANAESKVRIRSAAADSDDGLLTGDIFVSIEIWTFLGGAF